MKKRSLLFLLALLVTVYSYAQSFITFSVGGSTPVGEFASKDIYDRKAGMAKLGGNFDLSFGRLIYRNKLGFISTIKGQLNNFDPNLSKAQQSWYLSPKAGRYQSLAILIGPYFEFRLHKKLFLDLKIQGGYANSGYYSDIMITNTYYNLGSESTINPTVTTRHTKTQWASSFVALAGLSIKREMGQRLAVSVSVDCLIINQNFGKPVTQKNEPFEYGPLYYTITQSMYTINTNVGFLYRF